MDSVKVSTPTDLRLVAELIDHPVDEIMRLNPSLQRWTTPANDPDFVLYVPAGTKDKYEQNIAAIPADKRIWWRAHRVLDGETLAGIARELRISPVSLAEANQLTPTATLEAGSHLVVPMAVGTGRFSGTLQGTCPAPAGGVSCASGRHPGPAGGSLQRNALPDPPVEWPAVGKIDHRPNSATLRGGTGRSAAPDHHPIAASAKHPTPPLHPAGGGPEEAGERTPDPAAPRPPRQHDSLPNKTSSIALDRMMRLVYICPTTTFVARSVAKRMWRVHMSQYRFRGGGLHGVR